MLSASMPIGIRHPLSRRRSTAPKSLLETALRAGLRSGSDQMKVGPWATAKPRRRRSGQATEQPGRSVSSSFAPY